MSNLFERKDEDWLENRPILLFVTIRENAGKSIKREWKVRIRSAAEVDAWNGEGDKVDELQKDVSLSAEAFEKCQERLMDLKVQQRANDTKQAPAAHKDTQTAEDEIAAAETACQNAIIHVRKKTREWLDGMLECVLSYDPVALDHDALQAAGLTDAQIEAAYMRLRHFSNPLLAMQHLAAIHPLSKAAMAAQR